MRKVCVDTYIYIYIYTHIHTPQRLASAHARDFALRQSRPLRLSPDARRIPRCAPSPVTVVNQFKSGLSNVETYQIHPTPTLLAAI